MHPAVKVWHSRRLGMRWYPDLWLLHPDIAQAVIYLEAKEAEGNAKRGPSVVEQAVSQTIEDARGQMGL